VKLTKTEKLARRVARYLKDIREMTPYGHLDGSKYFFIGFPPPAPFAENYHRKTKNRRKRNHGKR
jgi:hypothetical protein